MSKRLNELAEIVLDRVYTYGYQQRAAEIEQCRAEDDLLAAQRKLADVTAERDKLASEIETLRQEVEAGDKALKILAADRDHWRESRQQAIEAGDFMRDEIATLRAQLAEAGDPAELERLRACVRSVGEHVELFEHCSLSLRAAIVQDLADCATANPASVSDTMDAEGGE